MQILHLEKNNKKQSQKAVEKIWFSSSNRDRYWETCQLPLYRINCAYSCWRQRIYFIIYWWPLVTTSNTIHSHTFSLEKVMHLKRKAKKDILSENIYSSVLVKRVKVNFPTNHILNSNLIIEPLCELWEVVLFVELRFILFDLQFFGHWGIQWLLRMFSLSNGKWILAWWS